MKQFSLEEYIKNPSRKIVTRDGKEARIVCTDKKGRYPIIALSQVLDDDDEEIHSYTKSGKMFMSIDSNADFESSITCLVIFLVCLAKSSNPKPFNAISPKLVLNNLWNPYPTPSNPIAVLTESKLFSLNVSYTPSV